VAIAKLVSPQFVGRPDLFAPDRFHPSGAGYRRAMDVLLPTLIDEMSARSPRHELPAPLPAVNHAVSA
jgi:lysophospholipase L1-like esterase